MLAELFIYDGSSFAYPENVGAAGTLYDAIPQNLKQSVLQIKNPSLVLQYLLGN